MNVKRNGVNLGFLAVDATLEPGPRRPFNFVGALNQHQLSHLSGLANKVLCPIIPGVIGLDGLTYQINLDYYRLSLMTTNVLTTRD